MKIIKFKKAIGEIPNNSLGILRIGINGAMDMSKVFIPNSYVSLSESILPCYEMPVDSSLWEEVNEKLLTENEVKQLIDLNEKVNRKEKLFIGDGILVKKLIV